MIFTTNKAEFHYTEQLKRRRVGILIISLLIIFKFIFSIYGSKGFENNNIDAYFRSG